MTLFCVDLEKPGDVMARFQLKDKTLIPSDVEVVNVSYAERYMGFTICLYHPSWPIVPMEQVLEVYDSGTLELEHFLVTKETKIEHTKTTKFREFF